MNKRLAFGIVLFILVIVGVRSYSNSIGARDVVYIAVVEENPGDLGNPNPLSIYASVDMLIRQLNEEERINGKELVVVVYSIGDNPEGAKGVAQQVVASNAVAVIGDFSVAALDGAGEMYDSYGIPFINVVPISELSTLEYSNLFNRPLA